MAQAASTALPPRAKVSAPAVAASGLPVTATQWRPCSTGLTVRCAPALWPLGSKTSPSAVAQIVCQRLLFISRASSSGGAYPTRWFRGDPRLPCNGPGLRLTVDRMKPARTRSIDTAAHAPRPRPRRPRRLQRLGLAGALLAAVGLGPPRSEPDARLILHGAYPDRMLAAVAAAGGRVTHRLPVIDGLAASVPAWGVEQLAASSAVHRLWPDRGVTSMASERSDRASPPVPPRGWEARAVRADRLHHEGVTGRGVTIAVIDAGLPQPPPAADGHRRLLARYDAVADRLLQAAEPPTEPLTAPQPADHASQLLSVMLSAAPGEDGTALGVAPNADLVLIRAIGPDGSGRVSDVVRGIGWAVRNQQRYGIRVLNLSLAAAAAGPYAQDPLNRAVMAAWRAGIVVVVAAGNGGPGLGTVGSPANVPYAVTVGATAPGARASGPEGGPLAVYSAAGPTHEGFVKPELVAPGGRFEDAPLGEPVTVGGGGLQRLASGTSLAAALVSGVAALVLETSPWLEPDQVKHRLMSTARPAISRRGRPAYSIFRQGAGLVDAHGAARSESEESANRGLDVELDLAGEERYRGPAERLADGTIVLRGVQAGSSEPVASGASGYTWSDGHAVLDGYAGSDGYTWSDGQRAAAGLLGSD